MRTRHAGQMFAGAATGWLVASIAGAQSAACTYERCALRVEPAPTISFESRLVQGIEAKPIATIGLSIPRIPLFETSADSIRRPYLAFRERQQTARVLVALGFVGLAASGIAALAGHQTRPRDAVPWLAVDIGLGVGAVVEGTRAVNALQTAVERYNAALPQGP